MGTADRRMTEDSSSPSMSDEQRKTRTSNRRTIAAVGLVVAVFAGPSVYQLGRHLIDLL